MAGFLDNAEAEVLCATCGRRTKKQIGWLKSFTSVHCACGARIPVDSEQIRREVASVEAEMAKLQRTLQRLGR